MENIENATKNLPEQEENALILSQTIEKHIILTAKWAGFLAILSYIVIGLMILASVFILSAGSYLSEFNDFETINLSFIGILYLLMALLWFLPTYFLHQFAQKAKSGIENKDQNSLNYSFKNLKSLFKYIGILTIIALSLMVILLISSIAVAGFTSF